MAANKRYYWLKMKKSFWDEPSVLFLRNLPSGDTLVIIYLKLLCMSLQNNGIIYFEGTYGTVEDEIALSLREDKMMVQMALSAMKKVNLVVMGMDDMEMQFTRIGEMVGIDSESASAKRVREHRARKALEQQQVFVCKFIMFKAKIIRCCIIIRITNFDMFNYCHDTHLPFLLRLL